MDLTHAPPCLKSLCCGSQSESKVLSTMSPGPSPSPLWLYSLKSTSPHAQTRTHTLVLWVAPEKMPHWKYLPTVGHWKHWVSVSLQLYVSVFMCLCVFLCFHHCLERCQPVANVKCFPTCTCTVFPHIPYFLFSAPLSHHLQTHAGKGREQQQKKQRHCYWRHRQSSVPGPWTGGIRTCGNKQPEAERLAVGELPVSRCYPNLRWAAPQAASPQLQSFTQIWTVATALKPITL